MTCSFQRVCTVGPDQTTFGSTRFITIQCLKDAHIKIFVVRNVMLGKRCFDMAGTCTLRTPKFR